LTGLSLLIGSLVWAGVFWLVARNGALAVGIVAALILMTAVFGSIVYLFMQSAAVAHLRGNATEVTAGQLPSLFEQLVACCDALGIKKRPTMYVRNGNGVLNAFATRFLGHKYVILLSNIVDAMDGSPNGVRFYIGHELGHVLRHDNILVAFLRWPALRLPLLGAAFSRARETTCDRHGLACSKSPEMAARSLAALSAGAKNWSSVSLDGYQQQMDAAKGFWVSFHELLSSYPWTGKRIVRVLGKAPSMSRRNPFAYFIAAFVPYAGRSVGAAVGMVLYLYMFGVVGAVAIPQYHMYVARAMLTQAAAESQPARRQLVHYYLSEKAIPKTLKDAGVAQSLPNGVRLSLKQRNMVLTVHSRSGNLIFTPRRKQGGEIIWTCAGGPGVTPLELGTLCH
jgi:Zn-dependent protease with chaperone function/type II secretory pathway pseudopilin PulG